MNFTETELMLMEDKPKLLSPENKKLRSKLLYQKNKEEICRKERERRKTPEGFKKYKKKRWKEQGLNMNTFENVFERFQNTNNCEVCNYKLETNVGDGKVNIASKCMNLCKETNECNKIVCLECNTRIMSENRKLKAKESSPSN
jgi:hypothetical protein